MEKTENKIYCKVCDFQVNKYVYDAHLLTTKHLKNLTGEVPMYKCDKCDFESNIRQTTHKHKKTHD
jgi:hypothetical protein